MRKEDPEAASRLEKLQRERLVLGERIERMISIIEEVEAS